MARGKDKENHPGKHVRHLTDAFCEGGSSQLNVVSMWYGSTV